MSEAASDFVTGGSVPNGTVPAALSVELWRKLASGASLSLSDEQIGGMSAYLDLLIEANKTMNLTRITDRQQAEVLHIGDALTLLAFLPAGGHRLADVGSGGGVPGIPLAIARPDVTVMLIESTQKKGAFLQRAVEQLGLKNVSVSSWRAEQVAESNSRESFHVVTARALAKMDLLAEWCLPLARVGGKVLAMKGPKVAEELPLAARSIRWMGGGAAVIHPVELPGTTGHVVVEIAKKSGGPKRVGTSRGGKTRK